MKELNQIGKSRNSADRKVKLEIAVILRDYGEAARNSLTHSKYLGISSIVEGFNNRDRFLSPDTIGITLCYPDKDRPTHMKCAFFSKAIGEQEFEKQVKLLADELLKKIPKE